MRCGFRLQPEGCVRRSNEPPAFALRRRFSSERQRARPIVERVFLSGDGRHMRHRAFCIVAGTAGLAERGERLRMTEQVFGDKQAEVSIDRLELRQAQRGAARADCSASGKRRCSSASFAAYA